MATTYITAVGRRKTSTASVRMHKAAKSSVMVNNKDVREFFKTRERVKAAEEALTVAESAEHYEVKAHVEGGGISSQADAVRHAIARALVKAEPGTRAKLKSAGFLTRDPRAKERKKPGLVKARKRKQWSKR